jgi:O-antigen/teichoic acid export membrane protein
MSSTAPAPTGTSRGATIGRYLIVIGGVVAALSSWLNWGRDVEIPERNFSAPARSAYTIPAKFVIDSNQEVPGGGLSLGIVVLVLGLLVIGLAFAPAPWWKVAGLVLGLAVGIVALLYAFQVRDVIHDNSLGVRFRDLISIGTYVCGIGGALAVVGAVIALIPPGFWSSLTSAEEEEEGEQAKPAGETGPP